MIQADGLSKRFNAFLAVDDLSLSINKGEVFGLLGHNGAGKTTTINMLAGLLSPSSGTARIMGFDVCSEPLKALRRGCTTFSTNLRQMDTLKTLKLST